MCKNSVWLFMGVFILKKISMKEFHSPPLALQSDHTEYGDLTVFLSDFEASKSVNTHFDTMLKRA